MQFINSIDTKTKKMIAVILVALSLFFAFFTTYVSFNTSNVYGNIMMGLYQKSNFTMYALAEFFEEAGNDSVKANIIIQMILTLATASFAVFSIVTNKEKGTIPFMVMTIVNILAGFWYVDQSEQILKLAVSPFIAVIFGVLVYVFTKLACEELAKTGTLDNEVSVKEEFIDLAKNLNDTALDIVNIAKKTAIETKEKAKDTADKVRSNATCPNCNKLQPLGSTFCKDCGTAMKTTVHCSGCGAEIAQDKNFCGKCGKKI
ncbi:MAG: zinc ribbon domain-containing protein [Clostridia bacterium]